LLRHCLICQKKIVRGEDVENHILVNHPDVHENTGKKRKKSSNLKFKCQECDYSSKMKGNLLMHVKSQHCKVKYICKECSFETGTLVTGKSHQILCHDKTGSNFTVYFETKCMPCSFRTENHIDFEEHVKDRHLTFLKFERRRRRRVKNTDKTSFNLPYKCKGCMYECKLKSQLKTHILVKHMKANFTCSNCNTDFRHFYTFTNHIRLSHNGDMSAFSCYCSSCDIHVKIHDFNEHLKTKHFFIGERSFSLRKVHRIKHEENPIYSCQDCDIKTEQKNQIIEHIFENHEVEEDLDETQLLDAIEQKFLQLSCKSCSFNGSFSDFHKHLKKEKVETIIEKDDVWNIKCQICSSNCKNSKALIKHKIMVHGQCQYACRKCEYRHLKFSEMLIHSKKEHNHHLQPYQMAYLCGFCSFIGTTDTMENHLIDFHSKEFQKNLENLQMFHCTTCDFQNINLFRLTSHTKFTHFTFDCGYCDESFSQLHKVNLHRIKFHQTTTFDCQQCKFKSKHRISLYRHKKEVHGNKGKFVCKDCDKRLNRKAYLIEHQESCKRKIKRKQT